MGGSKGVTAGASALGVAVQLDLDIGCVQRQLMGLMDTLEQLRDRQCRFRAGAAGEQHVVQVLVDMIDTGWTLLPDRRWPGTRRANIDVLLAGPGGIFVIDVKRWKDVRIETGALWRGDDRADDAVDNLAAQASVVQDVLGVPLGYWRDEIAHVIKGRGITDLATYVGLRRVGRRTALQPVHRTAMWQLFTEYEQRRLERGLSDWDDV